MTTRRLPDLCLRISILSLSLLSLQQCAHLVGVTRTDSMKNTAYIRVRVEGANTAQDVQNEVNSWYQGKAPFKITPEGNNTFLLCWPLLNPPGSTENFGADLKNPNKWTRIDCFEGFDNQSPLPEQTLFPDVCSPELRFTQNAQLGRIVVISNPSSSITLRVSSLQVANTTQNIGLDSMDYHNPAIEALAWFTLISSDTDIPPGGSIIQDVPDTQLSDFIYARSMYLSTSPGDTARPSVYELSGVAVPALSLLGAGVVALLLLYGAAMLMKKRNRVAPLVGA